MAEQNRIDYYTSIQAPSVAEFKDKGSKFIAYAFPIEDVAQFKTLLQNIKTEHPKANHHCFAYRIGIDGNNFRASDAGEPSGSAGRPILGQIDSKNLTNVLVIVVRYFGGTLLGVPGLINAYKTATALALQLVPTVKKAIQKKVQLDFDYTKMNEVMQWVKKYEGTVTAQEMQLFCQVQCLVPQYNYDQANQALGEMFGIAFKWI